ncbi:MAG: hypothetical protein WA082_00675 [Candidatus Moraniibacteriota bacterium]
MSELTRKILALITEQNIQPAPLWQARVRNAAYWVGTFVVVVFSALIMTLSFHALFEIDWDVYAKANFTWYQTILSGVPLFSLLLLAVFLWISIVLLHQTRRGYRYSLTILVALFLSTSSVFGYFIEQSPLDEPAERLLLYALPHDSEIRGALIPSAERQWSQPKRGLLGGSVQSVDAASIMLRDSAEKLWTVDYSGAEIQEGVTLQPTQAVKIIGEEESEDAFRATEVRVWEQPSVQKQAESKQSAEVKAVPKKENKEEEDDKKESEKKKSTEDDEDDDADQEEDEQDQDDDEDNHEDDEDEDGEDD